MLRTSLGERLAALESQDPRERAREAIRAYVRFAAAHPELFRLMVDEGKNSEGRMKWLVDTHLRPGYDVFMRPGGQRVAGLDERLLPHAYYVMAGAGSLIFAVAPECRRLTGLDPETETRRRPTRSSSRGSWCRSGRNPRRPLRPSASRR